MKKVALAAMLVASLALAGCCAGKCSKAGAGAACQKCPAGQCKCAAK